MIKNLLLKQTLIPSLSKSLDVYAQRHKTIASNISNVETPGYKRKKVIFEEKLRRAIHSNLSGKRTNPNHLPIGENRISNIKPKIEIERSERLYSGVNNVDIEKEIVDQVKNEIRFLAGTNFISKNFAALRASIKGRYDR